MIGVVTKNVVVANSSSEELSVVKVALGSNLTPEMPNHPPHLRVVERETQKLAPSRDRSTDEQVHEFTCPEKLSKSPRYSWGPNVCDRSYTCIRN